jgi:hypothetical protein
MTEEQVKKEIMRISSQYRCRPIGEFQNGKYTFNFVHERTGTVKARGEGATILEAKIRCIQMIKLAE